MRLLLGLVLAACSPAASSPALLPVVPPSLPAPKSAPAPTPVADPDESHLEHATVLGKDIRVEVSWMTMTGTMHLAEQLVITTSQGTLTLTKPADESGEVLPLVEQIRPAGENRWVLLGWSSYGSGMQAEHAWLVDGSAAPRVVDTLAWTSDRAHAGIAVDPTSPLRIGIPLPDSALADTLHDEGDWQLVHGTQTYNLSQLAKLRVSDANVMTVEAYTPPFHASASERGFTGHFVWFEARDRFVQ